MADDNTRYLDAFPNWLRTLGDDASALADLLGNQPLPESARRPIGAGLNYLFKSLDLVPDGIDDIGFLDDAFVIRIAAKQAIGFSGVRELDHAGALERLSTDVRLVDEFLGTTSTRLNAYVKGLWTATVRGRSVEAIATDAAVRTELVNEVHAFAKSYQTPSFTRDERTLVKMRSFLGARLPA